ncbi:helix-turn-helix domain-containing protein [Lysinibacillus xylanilyticus]|uniref:helix-turn-helix domain-containing protein n=1 Tax=Lysinibacillus xylanilyticus TaxID=582475 RepID=UPI00083C943C|nr:helix-turn-helix transcriptional regulator [Lysinibacillus xylanilyticus]
MASLGETIREARKKLNMTMIELAEKTELTQGYLSKIENNVKIPTHEVLKKLSETLEIPYMHLMEKAGYIDEKTIIDKAIDAQAWLIKEIRNIKTQISMNELELSWLDENRETNSEETDPNKKLDPAIEEVVKKRVVELNQSLIYRKKMLGDLNNQIEDYSNPQNDHNVIIKKLEAIIRSVEGRNSYEKVSNLLMISNQSTHALSSEERIKLDNFLFEYVNSPNFINEAGDSLENLELYSLQKGFNLYRKLNKEQIKDVLNYHIEYTKGKQDKDLFMDGFRDYLSEENISVSEFFAPMRALLKEKEAKKENHEFTFTFTTPATKEIAINTNKRLVPIPREEAEKSFYDVSNLLNLDGVNYKGRKLSPNDIKKILLVIEEMEDKFDYED